MALSRILGHERARTLLGRSLAGGRLPQALLLTGPEGVGKRTLALEVARALVCDRGATDACGECSHCRRTAKSLGQVAEWREAALGDPKNAAALNHRLHPDLVLTEPWPTGIKVEQVRDLVAEVLGRPFEARARAFVIDDAHAMTEQAGNALLKSLEEPPSTSHLILVASAPQALLPTIRSRCQTLRLSSLPISLLAARLAGELSLAPEESRMRATLAGGSLGAALTFESEAYAGMRDGLIDLLEGGSRLDGAERLAAADRLAEQPDLPLALTTLRGLLRDVAALRAGAGPGALLNADLEPRLAALARGALGARATELAERVGETRSALRGHANRALALDVLLDAIAG